MKIVVETDQPTIRLKGNALEAVKSFSYLGIEVGRTARVDGEVSTRLKKTATVYQMSRKDLKLVWVWVGRPRCVCSKWCLLYGAETWAVTQQDLRQLHAFQMKCLRGIVGVTLWHKVRNEDIFADTWEVPVEAQLKLMWIQWCGHLRRMPEYWPQWQVLKCRPQGKKRKPGGTSLS